MRIRMRVSKVCLAILYLLLVIVEVSYGGLNLELIATMTGENNGDGLGGMVKGLGDINLDGCDDVGVSIAGYNDCSGRVNIYFGSSEFDNIPDMILISHVPREFFGVSIAAGDVNGDQQNDIIIGADGYDRAYLYFGGSLLDTIPDLIFEEPVGPYGYFGWDVASAGDVNNDGFDDVIVSAVSGDNDLVYLYLGGENMDTVADAVFSEDEGRGTYGGSISSAGDVNGDSCDDMIVGGTFHSYLYLGSEQTDTTADLVFSEGQDVTSGDFNADGFSDVFTSSRGIYFGGINMDTTVDVHVLLGNGASGYFDRGIYCDLLVGTGGSYGGLGSAWVFLGGNPMDSIPDWGVIGEYGGVLGRSVSSAGDVNSDGVDDVIIGEPGYFFESAKGRAYVYAGDTLSAVQDWSQSYELPKEFELEQNYPNPFNPSTTVKYGLPRECYVKLTIYNILGRKVATLVDGRQKAGYKTASWDASSFSSGMYFYRLQAGDFGETKKMILLK